jgi:hypothetical protein
MVVADPLWQFLNAYLDLPLFKGYVLPAVSRFDAMEFDGEEFLDIIYFAKYVQCDEPLCTTPFPQNIYRKNYESRNTKSELGRRANSTGM